MRRDSDDDGVPLLWSTLLVGIAAVMTVLLFGRGFGPSVDPSAAAIAETGSTVESTAPETATEEGAAQSTTTSQPPSNLLMDVLRRDGRFDTLVDLLEENDLVGRLSGDGPFTLFAPTDDAFAIASLPGQPSDVRRLLFRHLADGSIEADALADRATLTMLDGSDLEVAGTADQPTIDGVPVVETDVEVDNGLIQVVSGVFELPLPTLADVLAADTGNFNTLQIALDATGLADALDGSGVVLLAPTEEAFSALPSGIVEQLVAEPERLAQLLRHHVLSGPLDGDGEYPTLAGDTVSVSGRSFDDARAAGSERSAAAGSVMIPIDAVLVPDGFELGDVNEVIGLSPIGFEPASAEITQEGQTELDRAAQYLIANPVSVEIGGHTDSNGDDASNLELSEARAQAVLDYLVDSGVDPTRLTAVGYGETQPVADNATEGGRAQNRRIEFTIIG